MIVDYRCKWTQFLLPINDTSSTNLVY